MSNSNAMEKLEQISTLIKEIDDPYIANTMLHCFTVFLNLMEQVGKNTEEKKPIDVAEQIDMVSDILGFSVRDMMAAVLMDPNGPVNKQADAEVLDFITANSELDDYEKFVAQNTAKEAIDFLKGAI